MISDDLVNSYHLLLCALDLVFTNALLCNARKDLLNPDFRGTLNHALCSYAFRGVAFTVHNQFLMQIFIA